MKFLMLIAIAFLWAQPLFAGSGYENAEKHSDKEMQSPGQQAHLGEMGPAAGLASTAPVTQEAQAEMQIPPQTNEAASEVKISNPKAHPLKGLRNASRSMEVPRDESPVFGHLSFVCGIIGFISLIGLFILPMFWPLMLIFSTMALIFGAVGISKHRQGRGWAIAGLALGIGVNLVMLIAFLVVIVLLLNGDYSYW